MGMTIGVARGAKEAMIPPKVLENIVILCFERRFSKQNSVIRLKSNILGPENFWPSQIFGLTTPLGMTPYSCITTIAQMSRKFQYLCAKASGC